MKKRAQNKFPIPGEALIEKLSHDGRGIARIEGKTTFIQQALPKELIRFRYMRKKHDFDEGVLEEILKPSPHRVTPHCPHYTLCGGCSWQHLEGQAQIEEKQHLLLDILGRVGRVQPSDVLSPLRGPLWNYRSKARLSVRFVEKKQSCLLGFREKNNPRFITEIDQCPVLDARVDKAIPALRTLLGAMHDPHAIAQVEVAAGDDDVALIFRNLSALTEADEEHLRAFSDAKGFRIFLQPGGVDSVYLFYPNDGQELLSYVLPEESLSLAFHPTDFTQINLALNRSMVQQALKLLALEPMDRVLDLFCGLGNFSLVLAKHASYVLGIEGSEAMVQRAMMNAKNNGLHNTEFLCRNLEDPSILHEQALRQTTKILLDPPRTGALEIVKNMNALNPSRILYVSCNPATLARDAGILVHEQGYTMVSTGVMDMFPHTAHVESMALFERE